MRAPTIAFFSSTNVPTLASSRERRARPEVGEWADLDAGRDANLAPDHREGMDRDIGLELDVRLDPGRPRIDDRHAREHVLRVDPVAELPGDERELDARVDALHLPRDGCGVDGDRLAVGDEQAERVGHVELALRVVRLERREHGPETVGAKDVDAGVDLAERELLGRRVRRLDDAREPAVRVANDAAVRARVLRLEGEHGRRRAVAAVRVDELRDERRR